MNYSIDLYHGAQQELYDAYNWYEQRSQGLGLRFINAVDKRLYEIAADPERYAKQKGNYRETRIDIFPYTIIYEVFKKERVVFILHFFHAKRNPKRKYRK